MRLVKDTRVLVAALRRGAGPSRRLLRALLEGSQPTALMGTKLWLEYLDLVSRTDATWKDSETSLAERMVILDAFAAVCEYITVRSLWRPNLPDEDDNHVMELAICGNAAAIVTYNLADFDNARFAPPGLLVLPPGEFLKNYYP